MSDFMMSQECSINLLSYSLVEGLRCSAFELDLCHKLK